MKLIVATAICGAIFCMCAWGLYGYVNLTLGDPSACDASSSCHRR